MNLYRNRLLIACGACVPRCSEKLYMRGNATIYTQCAWYMLGTNADTRMSSQEAVQDQNKQKCCICCVFVTQSMYPQYARSNLCQPYPALENTTTSSTSRKTRKSRCSHSQSHIGANSLPNTPMTIQNTSQRSYICVETLLFTPTVLGICSEQMLTHVWHLRKQYKTNPNKNVVFFVFL